MRIIYNGQSALHIRFTFFHSFIRISLLPCNTMTAYTNYFIKYNNNNAKVERITMKRYCMKKHIWVWTQPATSHFIIKLFQYNIQLIKYGFALKLICYKKSLCFALMNFHFIKFSIFPNKINDAASIYESVLLFYWERGRTTEKLMLTVVVLHNIYKIIVSSFLIIIFSE